MSYQMKHVSPSQIKTWRTCKRKWWYEKVKGIRQETTAAQQLGTDVHELLEHYVEYGKVLPDTFAGQIAKAALPMVNTNSKCEHGFKVPLLEGVSALGRIDFTHFGVIEDLKTTSSMRYAKSPEELKTDPQAVMYLWAAQRDPGLEFFGPINKFSHLVVETKVPHRTKRVDCELTDDEIEAGISLIRKDAADMKAASEKEVSELGYNLDACSMYGGCHLHGECYKEGLFWASKRKDGEMNPLLAKFRKEKKETEPTASVVQKGEPAPEPEPMPAVAMPSEVNPPDGISMDAKVEITETKKTRKKVVVPDWVPDHAGKTAISLKKADACFVYNYIKDLIMSGNTNLSTSDTRSMMGILDWSTDKQTAAECKAKCRELIEALPSNFECQASITSNTPEPVQDTSSTPEPKEPEPAVQRQKGWLFVGCKPNFLIQGCVQMDDMLAPIREAVTREDTGNKGSEGQRHWLLINDFGVTGSHRVAVTLDGVIKKGAELPPVILADYRLPGHTDAVTVLRPYYNIVEAL